ncbi:MAG: hypothetical protein HZB68_05920 [Candidatus Aenigmarchaeota archaeon]|nr:hypothetical protein [Candidatus Aenigmarchaeota archaeon]
MDKVFGEVTTIVDGNTFLVRVLKTEKIGLYTYKETERMRIDGLDAPALTELAGKRMKEKLTRKLFGNKVALTITGWMANGYLCTIDSVEKGRR